MNVAKILKDEVFHLPQNPMFHDFPQYLKGKFDRYLEKVKLIRGMANTITDEDFEKMSLLCDKIYNSSLLYLKGSPSKAIFTLSEGLNLIEPELYTRPATPGIFYRARNKDKAPFEAKDLFHIPYEDRHKISTQRYSLPGVPCFYFSNSPYLCWLELNQPHINDLYFSRIEIVNRGFKMVDLTLSSKLAINMLKGFPGDSLYLNFLKKWPLILACSIPSTRYQAMNIENANFKVEYVIPQLLMEWVQNCGKGDGIIYPPTKVISGNDYHDGFRLSFKNYAIPTKSDNQKGHCTNLLEKIKISEPIRTLDSKFKNPDIYTQNFDLDAQQLHKKVSFRDMDFIGRRLYKINSNGKNVIYGKSLFMELENELIGKETKMIQSEFEP